MVEKHLKQVKEFKMPGFIEKAEAQILPVIPLRGTVCFPSVQLNIDVMRRTSLRAFGAAAAANDPRVILLAQKDSAVENPVPRDLYTVGTVARIRQVVKNPDGNLSVVFEGLARAVAESIYEYDDYLRASVITKNIVTSTVVPEKTKATMNRILASIRATKEINPTYTDDALTAAEAIASPGMFADFVASSFLMEYHNKQQILETLAPTTRLAKLADLIAEEELIMKTEFDIQKKVRTRLDENQRDYFLREQVKVIQQELGEDADEIDEYADKIDHAKLPKDVRAKLKKELNRLAKTPFGAAESTVLRNYLDACLEIPFGSYSKETLDVKEAAKILDADHDGLQKVKERILEYIAVRQLSPHLRNQIICLVGPPGVGKTSVAMSIARALHRKLARVSLGGVRDEADIRGHRKTYVGAMPGRIVDALTNAKTMNPVIILDEIDKLSSDLHGDPASALLEVLDPEQNCRFRDHFVEFPIDLSDCLFIATANEYAGIPAPLLDRMETIELQTYSENEKLSIAKNHLIKKQMQKHGLKARQIKFTDDAILSVIRSYTQEAGVRNLERTIASLCRKAAKKIAEGEVKAVTVTPSDLPSYLGPEKFTPELPESFDPIGVINGLAYTQSGGDLLKVEVAVMQGTGKINLTGSLGEVMKESAQLAVSYARTVADKYGIAPDFYNTKDLHVHFPEGAIPKDGPSAGVAMTCSLISALSGRPCRRDVAMTGEITLHGRILPIGGLREKSFAAYRSGIKTVLIPKENVKDLTEVDEAVKAAITFIPCTTISDALSLALCPASDAPSAQKTEFGGVPRIIPEPIKTTIAEQASV